MLWYFVLWSPCFSLNSFRTGAKNFINGWVIVSILYRWEMQTKKKSTLRWQSTTNQHILHSPSITKQAHERKMWHSIWQHRFGYSTDIKNNLLVVSYDQLRIHIDEICKIPDIDLVVCDEGHRLKVLNYMNRCVPWQPTYQSNKISQHEYVTDQHWSRISYNEQNAQIKTAQAVNQLKTKKRIILSGTVLFSQSWYWDFDSLRWVLLEVS
jgi:SNF2 family DNA or RNA helicase